MVRLQMIMDETEDVEETLQRLQREWLLASSEDDGLDIKKPFTPSYCYGCARTAGVAVCRKPLPKAYERKREASSSIDCTSPNYTRKNNKPRTIPRVKSALTCQVSAKIKKKALSTLLSQKTGSAASTHSSQGNGTKKPLAKKLAHGRGAFPCNECGRVFTFSYNLRRHEKRQSCVTVPREYPCTECGETFSVKKTYLRHMQCHKPASTDSDRPYSCDDCDKTFSRVMYLSQHKRIHDTTRPFSCQYCARMFKIKYNLTCHEKTHLNI